MGLSGLNWAGWLAGWWASVHQAFANCNDAALFLSSSRMPELMSLISSAAFESGARHLVPVPSPPSCVL